MAELCVACGKKQRVLGREICSTCFLNDGKPQVSLLEVINDKLDWIIAELKRIDAKIK